MRVKSSVKKGVLSKVWCGGVKRRKAWRVMVVHGVARQGAKRRGVSF